MDQLAYSISKKIHRLSAEQLSAVDSFLDTLQPSGSGGDPIRAMMTASEPAFESIWSNPEDAVYDDL